MLALLGKATKTGKAVNIGRKFLAKSGEKEQKKKDEGGKYSEPSSAIIPRGSVAPVNTSVLAPVPQLAEVSEDAAKGDDDILAIKDTVISIHKILKTTFKNESILLKQRRKAEENRKRAEKEEELEAKKEDDKKEKSGGGKMNIPMSIMDRIKAFIAGFVAYRLVPFIPQLLELVKLIPPVIDFFANVGVFLIDALSSFLVIAKKPIDWAKGAVENLGGEEALEKFEGLLSAFTTFANIAIIAGLASIGGGDKGGGLFSRGGRGGRGGPKTTGIGGKGVGRTRTTSPAAARRFTSRFGRGAAEKKFGKDAVKSLGGKYARSGATNLARKATVGALGKGGTKAALKIVKPLVKRIPIIGGVLEFALSLLAGEPVGKAAFRAVGSGLGTWIGGALGSLIPVPFVGTAIGAFIGGAGGSELAGAMYDAFFGGKTEVPNSGDEEESTVEKKEEGGPVGDTETNVEKKLERTTFKTSTKKPDKVKIGKDIGGAGKLVKAGFNKKTVGYLVAASNEMKRIPLIGSIMGSAIDLLLGQRPEKSMLQSFSTNIVALNDFATVDEVNQGSLTGLLSASAMQTGGEVFGSTYGPGTIAGERDSATGALLATDPEQYQVVLSRYLETAVDSKVPNVFGAMNLARTVKGEGSGPFDSLLGPFKGLFGGKEKPGAPTPGPTPGPAPGSTAGPGTAAGERDPATGELVPGTQTRTPPGATTSRFGTAEQKKMLDAIAFAEGTTGSYGTLYGGKVIPELAAGEMTIEQVLKMQKTKMYKGESVYGSGYDSNATGRYQFMSYVLEEEIGIQGIDPSEKFTPEMQDRLILNRISRMRGVTPELLATEGMSDKVIDMLAPEFASFPNLIGPDAQGRIGTNTSYYGQGGKTATEIKNAYGTSTGEASAISIADSSVQPSLEPTSSPGEDMSTADMGSRERGEGSKLAGELGRFLNAKGVGEYGSGTHQHPEHPPWPAESGHSANSLHYESQGARALDIGGWGPNLFKRNGESGTDDQTKIIAAINEFNSSKGVSPVEFLHEGNEPGGHSDHVHIAYQGGGSIGSRKSDTTSISDYAPYEDGDSGPQIIVKTIIVEKKMPGESAIMPLPLGGGGSSDGVNINAYSNLSAGAG